jgi:hypothetical protein
MCGPIYAKHKEPDEMITRPQENAHHEEHLFLHNLPLHSLLVRATFGILSPMIFSKGNAGKWVASKNGKVIAVDTRLSRVLHKVKGYDQDALQLDLVPKTPFIAGGRAV